MDSVIHTFSLAPVPILSLDLGGFLPEPWGKKDLPSSYSGGRSQALKSLGVFDLKNFLRINYLKDEKSSS